MEFTPAEQTVLECLAHQDNEQRARGYRLFMADGPGLAHWLEILAKGWESPPPEVRNRLSGPEAESRNRQIAVWRGLAAKLRPLSPEAVRALLARFSAGQN